MPVPIIAAITTIGKVLAVVNFLSSGYKLGKEAEVAAAIQEVEDQVGLTEDIKWAWSWFDRRYYTDLGDEWKGYCYYAGVTIKPWYDVGHWQDVTRHCLEKIQYYLNRAALAAEPAAPIAGLLAFLDKLKKYAPYIVLGGGLIFSAILIAKATKKER